MDRSSCTAERHGTHVAYRHRCRCDDAREDWRLYNKRLREGRSHLREPVLGHIRMVQALQAIGWPRWMQAELAGLRPDTLARIHRQTWVLAATAHAIRDLYRRLGGHLDQDGQWTPPIEGPSRLTEDRSWAAGYPPPGAWVGQDIDDPAAVPVWIRPDDPDRVAIEKAAVSRTRDRWTALCRAEQAEAVRLATKYGVSMRAMQADWRVSSTTLAKRLDAA